FNWPQPESKSGRRWQSWHSRHWIDPATKVNFIRCKYSRAKPPFRPAPNGVRFQCLLGGDSDSHIIAAAERTALDRDAEQQRTADRPYRIFHNGRRIRKCEISGAGRSVPVLPISPQ